MDSCNYYPTERKGKAQYMLEEYVIDGKKTGVVIINAENVSKVLAMISTDSTYRKAMDKSAKNEGSYNGSSAYWFNQIHANNNDITFDDVYRAVIAIDNENSTHLNAKNNSIDRREKMANRIIDERVIESLECYVRNKNDGLPEEIFNKIARELEGRINPSFASKFCHFYAKAVNEDCDEFPIYDSVLFSLIPKYALHYSIKMPTLLSFNKGCDLKEAYKAYIGVVSNLSNCTRVSKTGIDQLLWYFYKGRSIPQNETFTSIEPYYPED